MNKYSTNAQPVHHNERDEFDFDLTPREEDLEDGPWTEKRISHVVSILEDSVGLSPSVDTSEEAPSGIAASFGSHKVAEDTPKLSRKGREAAMALSQKVTRRARSGDRPDQRILRSIASFRVPAASPQRASSVEAATPLAHNDNHIPVWKFVRDRGRLAMANEALEYMRGDGMHPLSWSLNLTPERISGALRHPEGFVDYIKRQLDRDLEWAEVSVPYYWFSVDVKDDQTERLHLHGGMLAASNDIDRIWQALCRTGGDMSYPAARYQLDMQPRCDFGWTTYAIRNRGRVRKIIGDRTISITQPLRSRAKWIYGQYRSLMKA